MVFAVFGCCPNVITLTPLFLVPTVLHSQLSESVHVSTTYEEGSAAGLRTRGVSWGSEGRPSQYSGAGHHASSRWGSQAGSRTYGSPARFAGTRTQLAVVPKHRRLFGDSQGMRAQGSMAFTNHAVQVVIANGRQALMAHNKRQFPPEMHGGRHRRAVPPKSPSPDLRNDSLRLCCVRNGGATSQGCRRSQYSVPGLSLRFPQVAEEGRLKHRVSY